MLPLPQVPETRPLDMDELTAEQRVVLESLGRRLQGILEEVARTPADEPGCAERTGPWFRPDPQRSPRVLMLNGARGTGKTTLLLTLAAQLASSPSRTREGTPPDAIAALRRRVFMLRPLDFDPAPPDLPFLPWLVQGVRPLVDCHAAGGRGRAIEGRPGLVERWRDCLRAAVVGWGAAGAPAKGGDLLDGILDREEQLKDWYELAERWRALLDTLLGAGFPDDPCAIVILPVDDLDMQPERSAEVLLAMRLLYHPRLVYLVTATSTQLRDSLELGYAGRLHRLADGADPGALTHIRPIPARAHGLAEAVLRKSVPPHHRFAVNGHKLSDLWEWTGEKPGFVKDKGWIPSLFADEVWRYSDSKWIEGIPASEALPQAVEALRHESQRRVRVRTLVQSHADWIKRREELPPDEASNLQPHLRRELALDVFCTLISDDDPVDLHQELPSLRAQDQARESKDLGDGVTLVTGGYPRIEVKHGERWVSSDPVFELLDSIRRSGLLWPWKDPPAAFEDRTILAWTHVQRGGNQAIFPLPLAVAPDSPAAVRQLARVWNVTTGDDPHARWVWFQFRFLAGEELAESTPGWDKILGRLRDDAAVPEGRRLDLANLRDLVLPLLLAPEYGLGAETRDRIRAWLGTRLAGLARRVEGFRRDMFTLGAEDFRARATELLPRHLWNLDARRPRRTDDAETVLQELFGPGGRRLEDLVAPSILDGSTFEPLHRALRSRVGERWLEALNESPWLLMEINSLLAQIERVVDRLNRDVVDVQRASPHGVGETILAVFREGLADPGIGAAASITAALDRRDRRGAFVRGGGATWRVDPGGEPVIAWRVPDGGDAVAMWIDAALSGSYPVIGTKVAPLPRFDGLPGRLSSLSWPEGLRTWLDHEKLARHALLLSHAAGQLPKAVTPSDRERWCAVEICVAVELAIAGHLSDREIWYREFDLKTDQNWQDAKKKLAESAHGRAWVKANSKVLEEVLGADEIRQILGENPSTPRE